MLTPRQIVELDRRAAANYAQRAGRARVQALLHESAAALEERLLSLPPNARGTYGEQQIRATLAQIQSALAPLQRGIRAAALDLGQEASERAAASAIRILESGEEQFGSGQPLALDHAAFFDAASEGARASILRRLSSGGTAQPGAEATAHPAAKGILQRYGETTIGAFEDVLRRGLVQRKPWEEMRDDLIEKSPFLEGKPAYWADRIVRTEVMGAYNRASFESAKEAHVQLGNAVKILAATFDDRTGADSYAVHGQIRRVDEPFETWQGPIQFPPARPNDREIVVTHREGWRIPPYLRPRTPAEVMARWKYDGRKGRPPPIPRHTTVSLRLFR